MKSIHSAPRDGTKILLIGGHQDFSEYEDDHATGIAVGWWDAHCNEWLFCSYDDGYYGIWEDPTHWLPLPHH